MNRDVLANLAGGMLMLALAPVPAGARTIVLTQTDTVKIASISQAHPRSSWAAEDRAGYFGVGDLIAAPESAVLIQWPLDRIPRQQRIVNAELTLPVHIPPGAGTRLYLWRLVAPWGRGVSHLYRQVRPDRLRWSIPGARGTGVDRAIAPTRVYAFGTAPQETRLDVTADIQLWYHGTVPNHGWMIATEDANTAVPLLPPLYGYLWTLRITYEPQ
ncbi:hypothetical protein HQ590_02935 [bacterium]|nr:hypothetical protein [bacterium]